MVLDSETIFVVGAPRSGTTYLSRALGLGEKTGYMGESRVFPLPGARYCRKYYRENMEPHNIFQYSCAKAKIAHFVERLRGIDRVKDAARHLVYYSKLEPYDLTPSKELYKVQNIQLNSDDEKEIEKLTDNYRKMLNAGKMEQFAQSYFADFKRLCHGTRWIVEKTPAHLWHLPVVHKIFPASKVVLIHRDKRDSVASYIKTFGKGNSLKNRYLPYKLWLKNLCEKYNQAAEIEKWAGDQEWISSIAYNDFVEDPIPAMKTIVAWLGLDYDFQKYSSYFPKRKVSANWERLPKKDKKLIAKCLKEQ